MEEEKNIHGKTQHETVEGANWLKPRESRFYKAGFLHLEKLVQEKTLFKKKLSSSSEWKKGKRKG